MQHIPGWVYLAAGLIAFWLIFAFILISTGFPFIIISGSLTTLALLSLLVLILLKAYQNNW